MHFQVLEKRFVRLDNSISKLEVEIGRESSKVLVPSSEILSALWRDDEASTCKRSVSRIAGLKMPVLSVSESSLR